jgi:MFS family permease
MRTNNNIGLLYLIKASKWFMLYMPVIFLFYQENGFKTTELFVLHAIYSIVIVILEVPSGYFADVWGRKLSLTIGSLMGVIGFAAYSLSYHLWGFILAEVMLGIGESFISGADSALLYDTLLQEKKEHRYIKIEGSLSAVGNICEALAGLFVSLIVFNYLRTDFILQTILSLIAFIACLFLKEPVIHSFKPKPGFRDIWNTIHETFRENKLLARLVILSSLAGYASLTMAWFAQPILVEIGIDKSNFGYAWVILNLTVAAGSFSSAGMDHAFKRNGTIIILSLILSFGFIVTAFNLTYMAILPLLVFYFFRGVAHPIYKNYINNLTGS